MRPILYLYRSCTSCRNAASVLDAFGVAYESREFFKESFTRDVLESILRKAGMSPADLVSTRSTAYRAQGLDRRDLSDDDLISRMLAEPRLIRRPILVTDNEVLVGFNRDRFEAAARNLAG